MPPPGARDAYGRPMPQGKGFIKGADIYRPDDGGKTWRRTSRYDEATTNHLDNHSGTYGWVFGQIRVDPTNENTIYSMGVRLGNVSRDGGKTFTRSAACTATITGCGSIRPTRHPLQRQRRRLLPVRRRAARPGSSR